MRQIFLARVVDFGFENRASKLPMLQLSTLKAKKLLIKHDYQRFCPFKYLSLVNDRNRSFGELVKPAESPIGRKRRFLADFTKFFLSKIFKKIMGVSSILIRYQLESRLSQ